MIIYDDFKERFYNVILQAQNVVIVPNVDVDALAATFILTKLFDADEVMNSVVPVCSWEQLRNVFEEHKQVAKHFILLNCGGFRSLIELELPSNFCVFVFDVRRPFDLDNVFNENTVRLVCQESEIAHLNLPQPSQIYNQENSEFSDEEDGEEQDENRMAVTARRMERRMLKRGRNDAWRKKRNEILWKYSHKSYISLPISVLILKIAHSMSKTNAGFTWAAAVGLSSYLVDHSVSITNYSTICLDNMKPYLRQFGGTEKNKADPTLRITFEKDLVLPLYRHWTLDESIRLDIYFICSCRLWTQRGREKIKSVFASLGIPLTECTNSFERLDSNRRKEIADVLNGRMNSNFATFFSHKGYARGFSSADFARVIALELQFSDPIKSHTELFTHSLKFLRDFTEQDGGTSAHMLDALRHYKTALSSLTQLVYDSILQKHFIQTESFIGLTIKQQCTELGYLRSSHCLNIFLHIAIRVFHGTKQSSQRLKKPLFIAVLNPNPQQTAQRSENYYLFSGSMPLGDVLSDPDRKTFIPRVFEELAQDKTLNLIYDSIDPNVILVREDSYAEFFSRLDTRLPSVS